MKSFKILKIWCQNCEGVGIIFHPEKKKCPFCDGAGYKDVTYELNSDISSLTFKEETKQNFALDRK